MKKLNRLFISILATTLIISGCKKGINRLPETSFNDGSFWNTENDLIYASNRLYQELDGDWIDNRADDAVNQTTNEVSTGNRSVPNQSADWNDRYDEIFTANNIIEKAPRAKVADPIKNRYIAEARFFRAYAYSKLVKLYGDVPLVLHTLDVTSPDLYMGRTSRIQVVQAIYDDLDYAAIWLPKRADLPAAQYGRVTRSSAWALKARVALYEGTRAKFHNVAAINWQNHLAIAIAAAQSVMGEGHTLYSNYGNLFTQAGEGPTNTENILVKIYGVSNSNVIVAHNNSRDLENGRMAPTRNLIRQYLYSDGLPAFNVDNTPSATVSSFFVAEGSETSYNTILNNRDPRVAFTYFRTPDVAYQGPWIPKTSLGSRTAFAPKKGFSVVDQTINNGATTDRILIRYAEVLLVYAEAKYELNGSISDADLNLTINALRTRVAFAPKLTNAFVTTNNLNMRDEIRRERTVELALEGFRYDDLIRWKLAEVLLPKDLLGAKFIASEWVGTNGSSLNLNADQVLVTEPASTRHFRADRDYLYPVPIHEISTSGGSVTQNPNW